MIIPDAGGGCMDGDVRLHSGVGPSNGYVEFCHDRVWVGVCSGELDINTTRVACRQLGFDAEGK